MKTSVFVIIFALIGVMMSSVFVHETVHAFQADWEFRELCFIGIKDDMMGWMRPLKPMDKTMLELEIPAYSIQMIYILVMLVIGYILAFKRGDKDERKMEQKRNNIPKEEL